MTKINLKENEFFKINEYVYLCYIQKWGTEEFHYVIAVNSYPKYFDVMDYEIYGFGKTIEEALIMSVSNLVKSGLKGIPFESFEDSSFSDIIELIKNEEGSIASIPTLLSVKCEEEKMTGATYVVIKDHQAFPILQ